MPLTDAVLPDHALLDAIRTLGANARNLGLACDEYLRGETTIDAMDAVMWDLHQALGTYEVLTAPVQQELGDMIADAQGG